MQLLSLPMKPRKDKVLTGLAGEYYVLAQLAERGFTAALTLGNSKNVDIIVSSPNGKKIIRLEVETSSLPLRHEKLFGNTRFHIWAMGEKHEKIKDRNLIYCFVVLKGKGDPFSRKEGVFLKKKSP